jgi:hypothetical protein
MKNELTFFFYFRYKQHNLITIMIAHGPKKPSDIHTFLFPIYEELVELATDGLAVQCGNDSFLAKVHLLTFTGDLPAVADLANHSSYMSKYGCRICTVAGMRGHGGGMYFMGNAAGFDKRTVKSFQADERTVSSTLIFISQRIILIFFL